jgi:predicted DNA-binding transcriptional regulator YafY
MNRTDRLLAIVLESQARGRRRAEDLAKTFETSKRTIYRDIQALGEAGVPLIAIPGHGYSLMKGYFLPPLSFSTEEATMLLLGSEFMAQNFDAQYRQAAQSAGRKIAGVLPEKLQDEVQYLQNSIYFIGRGVRQSGSEMEMLRLLRRAIIDRNRVRFCYHTRYTASGQREQQTREADPYGLIYAGDSWLITAYCHLRKDIRNFRIDRMENLELLPDTFNRPPDYKVQTRKKDEISKITVRLLFDQETTRWVRESRSFFTVNEEETPDGLLVTLNIRQENEIMQWLLGWGGHVRVLEPESLRRTLAAEAEAMIKNYQQPQ